MRSRFTARSTILELGIVVLLSGCDSGGYGHLNDQSPPAAQIHDGQIPTALIQGNDGDFYGVTSSGGDFGEGTVFRVAPDGEEVVLYSFAGGPDDGGIPQSLIEGRDGNFYGTTGSGGFTACQSGAVPVGSPGGPVDCGTVFQVTPDGKETVLYYFRGQADGGEPTGALIQGSDGFFYGIAGSGGVVNPATGSSGGGVVYRITGFAAESVVYSFTDSSGNGARPASVTQANDGSFYVTTVAGGTADWGAVVRISAQGTESVFYSFKGGLDGELPSAPLTQAADGNFYSVSYFGGENGHGTFYRLTPAGVETDLYNFGSDPGNGTYPVAIVSGAGDSFYGFADAGGLLSSCGGLGCGSMFHITTAGDESAIYLEPQVSLAPNAITSLNVSSLVAGQDGNLYGTTTQGGQFSAGMLFRLTPGGVFTIVHSFGAS